MNQKRAVQPRVYFHQFAGMNLENANQEPARSRLAGRAQQVLAYYLPSGLLMRCGMRKQERSPICLVIKASAGSRFTCDRWILVASLGFLTQILLSVVVDDCVREDYLFCLTELLCECLSQNTPFLRTCHDYLLLQGSRSCSATHLGTEAIPTPFPLNFQLTDLLVDSDAWSLYSFCNPEM
jgi:hypothetical protein